MSALDVIRLAVAWYIVSVQVAMFVLLLIHDWQENRFGFRPSPRRYDSVSSATLAGVAEAGHIMLRALRWPYFAWMFLWRAFA